MNIFLQKVGINYLSRLIELSILNFYFISYYKLFIFYKLAF